MPCRSDARTQTALKSIPMAISRSLTAGVRDRHREGRLGVATWVWLRRRLPRCVCAATHPQCAVYQRVCSCMPSFLCKVRDKKPPIYEYCELLKKSRI